MNNLVTILSHFVNQLKPLVDSTVWQEIFATLSLFILVGIKIMRQIKTKLFQYIQNY